MPITCIAVAPFLHCFFFYTDGFAHPLGHDDGVVGVLEDALSYMVARQGVYVVSGLGSQEPRLYDVAHPSWCAYYQRQKCVPVNGGPGLKRKYLCRCEWVLFGGKTSWGQQR